MGWRQEGAARLLGVTLPNRIILDKKMECFRITLGFEKHASHSRPGIESTLYSARTLWLVLKATKC